MGFNSSNDMLVSTAVKDVNFYTFGIIKCKKGTGLNTQIT